MKKIIIICVLIFLLLLSLTFCVFVKKHFDYKTFDFFHLSKLMLGKKNAKYTQDNVNYREALKRNNILKSDNWEKVTDDIYIDKRSIKKSKYSTSAWFLIFNSEKLNLSPVEGIPVFYDLIKYDAGCNSDFLCLDHIKIFDENGNILLDEFDTYNICSDSSGWIEGETAFKTLCTYRKKRE